MRKTHRHNNERLYNVWNTMRNRCRNPLASRYERYGGRGINYAEEWDSFDRFYEDIGYLYKPGLQLDRIDNDGNYEPGNVQWITNKDNGNKRSNNRIITIGGVTMTFQQWCESVPLKRSVVSQRFYVYKWTIEESLYTPILRIRS